VYKNNRTYARQLDERDPLKLFRTKFYLPKQSNGEPYIYLSGNSLGLQPKTVEANIQQELTDWKNLGVEGHLHAKNPWLPYHEFLTKAMANVVGAKPAETVVMNTLSVNLHLMMVSFYRPSPTRHKILIESDVFPSDRFAVESQIKFHGYYPKTALLELKPREGEFILRADDIEHNIEQHGNEIALILMGNTNYYTGQFFDMKRITTLGHQLGCIVGFDCAHGAGNIPLNLHESSADFAVWCTYKYLNSGPGSLGGCFIHERHITNNKLPRFNGWWGQNKATRFEMSNEFDPIPTVEAWQLSNPTIFSMAAIKASLDIFEEAGIENLRKKSLLLTGYLEFLIDNIESDLINIITPKNPKERGCQLSIQVKKADKTLFEKITKKGIIADWREPDVIRVAPTPLYNTFEEVYQFVDILKAQLVKDKE